MSGGEGLYWLHHLINDLNGRFKDKKTIVVKELARSEDKNKHIFIYQVYDVINGCLHCSHSKAVDKNYDIIFDARRIGV